MVFLYVKKGVLLSRSSSIREKRIKNILWILCKKILLLIVFLFILSVMVFLLSRFSPGDPLHAFFGDTVDRMTESQKAAATKQLALDQPLFRQYTTWLTNFFHGDLGISYQYKQPVSAVIGNLWLNTLLLGGLSYLLMFLFAILLGVFCAKYQGGVFDTIIRKVGTVTNTIPSFFVALIFILIFAVNLSILPMGGAYSLGGSGELGDRLKHLILPVSVMVLSHLWYYAYIIRNKMIEELFMDYVSLLKVKGVSRFNIVWKHCFRNALPSLISIMAISVPHIIGGTYIVEMVFSYPGLGKLSFESAVYHDYNMLSALCLITGAVVLIFNMLGEEISQIIDPRMKERSRTGIIDYRENDKDSGIADENNNHEHNNHENHKDGGKYA